MTTISKHNVTINIVSSGFWLFFLKLLKANGWCSCWSTIYLRADKLSQRLCRHEYEHHLQMKREGAAKMMLKYLYYNVKYGYLNNPYEVEARHKQYDSDYIFV